MKTTISKFAEGLKASDGFVLFCHSSPDSDTLGSAFALSYALKKLGKSTVVYCSDKIPKRLEFLKICGEDVVNTLPQGNKTLFSVDIASYPMLKGLDEEYLSNLIFDFSLDHHDVNKINSKHMICDKKSPATGEIAAKLIKALGVEIDKNIALWLYAAISSDSGCFKYSSTRPATMKTAAVLMATGIDFAKINRLLFESKSPSGVAFEKAAYNNLKLYYSGRVAIVCIPRDITDSNDISEVDAAYQIPRQIEGVEVSAVITDRHGEIKVSFRSNDYYDVSALAEKFGGGGHVHASACRFYTSMEDAESSIVRALKDDFS